MKLDGLADQGSDMAAGIGGKVMMNEWKCLAARQQKPEARGQRVQRPKGACRVHPWMELAKVQTGLVLRASNGSPARWGTSPIWPNQRRSCYVGSLGMAYHGTGNMCLRPIIAAASVHHGTMPSASQNHGCRPHASQLS